jgi:transposase
MIVFQKFGQHQPLNRQAERYALEGVPIALSTMADAVGTVSMALDPLRRLIEAHVMVAERLHGAIRLCRGWPKARRTLVGYGSTVSGPYVPRPFGIDERV